jgi:Protein of unknown function (DUF3592)
MQLTRRRIYLLLGWTGSVTGLCFLVLAIGFATYEVWFLSQSSRAKGIVTANIPTQIPADVQTNTPARTSFCPQFQYQTPDGITQTNTSSACSNPPVFAVGDQIQVNYLKTSEGNGQVDSFGEKWGLLVAFLIAAFALMPVGIFFFRRLKSQGLSIDPMSYWD